MKKCTYCGKEYSDEATACAVDDQPLAVVPQPRTTQPQPTDSSPRLPTRPTNWAATNERIDVRYLKGKHEDATPAKFVGKGTVAFRDGSVSFDGQARGFTGEPAFKVIAAIGAIPAAIGIGMVTGIFPLWILVAFMVLALVIDAMDRKDESVSLKADSVQSVVEDLPQSRFLIVAQRTDSERLCIAWQTNSTADASSVSARLKEAIPSLVTQGSVKGTKTS